MSENPSPIAAEHLRTLRALYAAAKEALCPCGVAGGNCKDHRDRTEEQA